MLAALLVAKQNNKLLIKNHQSRPPGKIIYPKINAIKFNQRCGGGYNHKKNLDVMLVLRVLVEADITIEITFMVDVVDDVM